MRFRRQLAVVLVAFATGVANPVGWLFWRAAEWRLPQVKVNALAARSPFESVPQSRWVAQSDHAFVIEDREPQAPTHLLVISREHVRSILEATPELVADMVTLATSVARKRGIADDGFRLVINTNPKGAQTVYHFHMHVLGGRQMRWPPG